ncbi:hypothetical protein BD560DRAFT_421750 [Blakeslea trispora]|nr:hypothetical protein BD560DRAFT_421750 [Blakeslea trispora]
MQYIGHRHSKRRLWFGSTMKREQSGKLLSCKLTSILKKRENIRLLLFSSSVLSLILIIHAKQKYMKKEECGFWYKTSIYKRKKIPVKLAEMEQDKGGFKVEAYLERTTGFSQLFSLRKSSSCKNSRSEKITAKKFKERLFFKQVEI